MGKDAWKEGRPPKGIIVSETLLPDAQHFYDWVLPPELQRKYEDLNDGIVRMGGLRENGFVPEGFRETNLDHIINLLEMAREYKERCPALDERVNFAEAQKIILLHDAGELVVGDIKPVGRSPREERLKIVEPYLAKKCVFSEIPNQEARSCVIGLYNAYIENDPENLTVQMAHFIDKAQGTTRVAEIVFNVYRMQEKATQIGLHLWMTVSKMMAPAINLLTNLETREERGAMREIILGEIRLLEKYAPKYVGVAFRMGVEGD